MPSQWLDSPHAGELTPMSWDELGELSELGWELGSHTRTHPRLRRELAEFGPSGQH